MRGWEEMRISKPRELFWTGWFAKGDRAFVGDAILDLRERGMLKRVSDPDAEQDWGYYTISDEGRAALGDHRKEGSGA